VLLYLRCTIVCRIGMRRRLFESRQWKYCVLAYPGQPPGGATIRWRCAFYEYDIEVTKTRSLLASRAKTYLDTLQGVGRVHYFADVPCFVSSDLDGSPHVQVERGEVRAALVITSFLWQSTPHSIRASAARQVSNCSMHTTWSNRVSCDCVAGIRPK
jgi:hypothetical protein